MTTDRIARLEQRLQQLEDQAALYQLLSAMGPVTDTGTPQDIAALYTSDGEYRTDVPGSVPAAGRQAVAALFDTPMHRTATSQGSGHTFGFPRLWLHGDRAEGICHSVLYLRRDEGWMVARVAANHFIFERSADGWRVKRRWNRLLGSDEARRLFSEAPFITESGA
jgi:SnoaL-like domain